VASSAITPRRTCPLVEPTARSRANCRRRRPTDSATAPATTNSAISAMSIPTPVASSCSWDASAAADRSSSRPRAAPLATVSAAGTTWRIRLASAAADTPRSALTASRSAWPGCPYSRAASAAVKNTDPRSATG
jgi:hypothetical protein